MGILVLAKTVVVHLDALPVNVPAVILPEILDVVVPRLHIRVVGNLGVKLLERVLANFRDHVVDGQLDKPQVLRGKVISVVSSLKNLNGFFAVCHSTLPVSIPPLRRRQEAIFGSRISRSPAPSGDLLPSRTPMVSVGSLTKGFSTPYQFC